MRKHTISHHAAVPYVYHPDHWVAQFSQKKRCSQRWFRHNKLRSHTLRTSQKENTHHTQAGGGGGCCVVLCCGQSHTYQRAPAD